MLDYIKIKVLGGAKGDYKVSESGGRWKRVSFDVVNKNSWVVRRDEACSEVRSRSMISMILGSMNVNE